MDLHLSAVASHFPAAAMTQTVDTSSWILRRDDERRFAQKPVAAPRPNQRKKATLRQGNVALRSMVVDLL